MPGDDEQESDAKDGQADAPGDDKKEAGEKTAGEKTADEKDGGEKEPPSIFSLQKTVYVLRTQLANARKEAREASAEWSREEDRLEDKIQDLKEKVEALEKMGHKRKLVIESMSRSLDAAQAHSTIQFQENKKLCMLIKEAGKEGKM